MIKVLKHFIYLIKNIRNYNYYWILRSSSPIEIFFIHYFISRKINLIYEFDDAIYLAESKNFIKKFIVNKKNYAKKFIKISKRVICGNENLEIWAKKINPRTLVIPSGDVNVRNNLTKSNTGDLIKIVWIGSPMTSINLDIIFDALTKLSYIYNFQLILIGSRKIDQSYNFKVIQHEWDFNIDQILYDCDIGIAPLFQSNFNEAKCGYKIIQYMNYGLPFIASPVGVQIKLVNESQAGFLAQTHNEWVEKLDLLISNKKLRKELGVKSKIHFSNFYDVKLLADFYKNLFLSI
jgi:glycosyltransferase involved in cell wall biosynthesis